MPRADTKPGLIAVPWGAWRHDAPHAIETPTDWELIPLAMHDGAPLGSEQIDVALDSPIGAPRLEQLVHSRTTVAIAVDDITRPTPVADVLPSVLTRLRTAGVPDERITIIVATGAHRRATSWDIEQKVGATVAKRLRVVSHDPLEPLADTGVALAGVAVQVNREFAAADLRIGIGCVLPHPFAAFSGGGKIVIPGMANLDVLVRTHKYALMGLSGGHVPDANRFRTDMEAAVRAIGLQWTVNVVVNAERRIAFVSAGDLVLAHRAAAAAATRCGRTAGPATLLDAVLLNAYPKDGELLQIEAALVALRSGMLQWLTPTAPIVLMAACVEGLGSHGLFGTGGRLNRPPTAKGFLAGRPLLIYAPGVRESEARTVFWSGYPFHHEWPPLVAQLSAMLPASPRIGVVPCGPLQLAAT